MESQLLIYNVCNLSLECCKSKFCHLRYLWFPCVGEMCILWFHLPELFPDIFLDVFDKCVFGIPVGHIFLECPSSEFLAQTFI